MSAAVTLVTGAAGFVGGHLLDLLLEAPDQEIVAWRRRAGQTSSPRPPRVHDRVTWTEVDLLDPDRVADAVRQTRPTRVYHLAGVAGVHASWDHVVDTLDGNVRGTEHLLGAVAELAPEARVLIPGSALVYRPASEPIDEHAPLGPVSPYGVSKLAQELLARQFVEDGVDLIQTRSFTHVGPGQLPSYAASSFARQVAEIEHGQAPPLIKVGDLDAERDLLDVRDTVRAYRALESRGRNGGVYNVCSGVARRIGDVLEHLVSRATVRVTVEQDGARLRPKDNRRLLGDPGRLRAETDWQPIYPLERTLDDLLDWWRRTLSAPRPPA